MIVEIFVAQGQGIDSLPQHILEAVIAFNFTAGIFELGCNPFGQSQAVVGFAKQKNTGVGGDLSAAKISDHFASLTPFERDRLCGTNCHGKTSCEILSNQLNYITITEFLPFFMKYPEQVLMAKPYQKGGGLKNSSCRGVKT
jgi:hypothetical protein